MRPPRGAHLLREVTPPPGPIGAEAERDAPLQDQDTLIAAFIEDEIRPKVRVDGGDVTFAALEDDTVMLNANADCATCPAVDPCLAWWIRRRLRERFGRPFEVVIRRNVPYFKR